MMIWDSEQSEQLRHLAHEDAHAYVRLKALALLKVGEGKSEAEVAAFFDVSARSLSRWRQGFASAGVGSLYVKPGRGRRPRAQPEEVAFYVRQSPRNFGLAQTRWTLRALAQVVPSLKGLTLAAVHYALGRAGYAYKRGQPSRFSPDPAYAEKGGVWQPRLAKRERVVAP